MFKTLWVWPWLCVIAGCGDSADTVRLDAAADFDGTRTGSEQGPAQTSESLDPAGAGGPSFWQDVAPVFNDKCVRCHQAGGIAPFALDDYPEARERANQIAAITEARIMPPYLMETGGDCGSFDEQRALSAAQIELIQAWAAAGAREGQRAELTRPELPTLKDAREWSTPRFVPEIQGGALAEFDEYRCFRVDLGVSEPTWVTGWEVLPGNPEMVHHVIGFIVDPAAATPLGTNAEVLQALDAESPDRLGWPCFGAAGEAVQVEAAPVIWAPGAGAITYPNGVGIAVAPGREMVVQVHYNLASPEVRGQSDQTRVKLQFAADVERQGIFLLEDRFLATLYNGQASALEPGRASVPFTWSESLTEAIGTELPFALDLVAVSPHMHTRGRTWTLELGQAGNFDCIGRVKRWDFNWQNMYTYQNAPQLRADSQLRLTCEFDTSADTAPVLPGWGTRNEMCLATLLVALPPGVRF